MKWLVRTLPGWVQEILPIFLGLVVGYFYFTSVVPEAAAYGRRYLAAFAVIFVLTRLPRSWYYRTHLRPPILRYKEARRSGRTPSRTELEAVYIHLAAFVPRSQMLSGVLWLFALVALLVADKIWMVGSLTSFWALLFGAFIVTSVALTLTYFLLKERMRPLVEEVQGMLDSPPSVDRWRVPLMVKMVGFVTAVIALAMFAFGLFLYTLMLRATEDFALREGEQHLGEFAATAESIPEAEWDAAAERLSSPMSCLFLVRADGTPAAGCGPSCHGGSDAPEAKRALEWLRAFSSSMEGGVRHDGGRVQTKWARAVVRPLSAGGQAGILLHPRAVRLMLRPVLISGSIYLLVTLTILAVYIGLMGRDQSELLHRMEAFTRRMAAGDLRKGESFWNDDEIGRIAEDLRATFYGLRRMVTQASEAAGAVDREVGATAAAADLLRRDAATQARSASASSQAVAGVAGGIHSIGASLEAVTGATQDVSSAVLEMQASVEEIATNAGALSGSVEKSVSTTNEIAATAQQVSEAGSRLQEASRESVAFFTELDAALEETRRNAEGLLAVSSKVTGDAEAGFGAVAAVEEQILRIRKAGETNLEAFGRLRASMERIGKIVDVIQEVSAQTNLLALNASILAAGAGEHGRAFAVVATQVRELSGRTAGHASEIRGVIRTLLESGRDMAEAIDRTGSVIETSTDLSCRAGEALRTILESASSQEEMSRRISSATEELAHGGKASSRSMHQIYEMAEGIGHATSEQAKATRFLNQESERVRAVADLMKNATEEQARGARVMSEAVTRITGDSEEVAGALRAQAKEAAAIDASVRDLAGTAEAIGRAVEEFAAASQRLRGASEALGGEIRKFQL